MDNRTAEFLMRILRILGASMVANLIDFRADVPEKKLWAALDEFADTLERKYKAKLFSFKDRTRRSLIRYYIIDCRADLTIAGEPTIVINDFPEGLRAEKNPVLKLELVYDDVEVRDQDLKDLKFMIS